MPQDSPSQENETRRERRSDWKEEELAGWYINWRAAMVEGLFGKYNLQFGQKMVTMILFSNALTPSLPAS